MDTRPQLEDLTLRTIDSIQHTKRNESLCKQVKVLDLSGGGGGGGENQKKKKGMSRVHAGVFVFFLSGGIDF